MANRDTGQGAGGISRRDFLKTSAAASAVVGCGLGIAYDPEKAAAYEGDPNYKITPTTCPYCSASCGQRVVVSKSTGKIVDMYGDFESPMNSGGLCSKGAGTLQLVNNPRRIGAFTGTHPVNPVFAANTTAFPDGVAYKRTGNDPWSAVSLDAAMADIAPKLKNARGLVAPTGTVLPLFTAGDAIKHPDTSVVTYKGFSGLNTVQKADGTYFVATNGNKKTSAELLAIMNAVGLGTAPPSDLLAAFDSLVFTATDPTDKATYTIEGTSDIGAKLLGLPTPVFANTGDVVRDGSTYYSYAVDANTGEMHVATSADMKAWTYGQNLGKPSTVGNMTSPSVLKSGSDLKVWYVDVKETPAPATYKLQYATFTAGAWSAPVNVTVNAVDPSGGPGADFLGHPLVTSDGTTLTLQYVLGSGGIKKATALVASPATFTGLSSVYDQAGFSEGNVSVGNSKGVLYTTYSYPHPANLGWAYSDVKAVITATAASNSYGVAFFGSSHMNNESNYMYRKIIANFGTSNVEHQARI